ncbi:DUF3857 domain-containing protein [Litoribrevibacter euphylliae]|uniref:DUF3857 domain-containing protein n=1 Tax=Litoribrevibacter euphylliae TaxID=1834034 RepID=A0ABV7HGB9_9GAMM
MDFKTKLIWILLSMVFINQLYADQEYQISKPAKWIDVTEYDPNTPSNTEQLGDTRYILYDRQTNAIENIARYYHFAFQVLNETSVETNGQHFFNFAPSFETLTFHRFDIIRDGQKINQLKPEQINVLHRETEAEGLIYNGELSASFILEDLRPGDIIDYSYTITGQNPALEDNFYEYIDLQWGTPLESLNYSLLWPNEKSIYIQKTNTDIEISETSTQDYKRINLQLDYSEPLTLDSQTPYEYNPRARVSLSNNNEWANIVDWALPLYALDTDTPLLDPIIKDIRQKHSSIKDQASAALHYVQDNIRYLGLELGNHSLVPANIASTLEKRYGDCKGKTLLLLNLLDRLNIESYPALVNNNYITTFNADGVRISAFNHVLLTAFIDGQQYWLDPTINNQETNLDKLYQPDYGEALVLKPGQQQLTMMDSQYSSTLKQVKEVIDLSEGIEQDGQYTITTKLTGYEAELFRREIEANTVEQISKRYLNFYNYYYPDLTPLSPFTTDYADDAFSIVEQYRLPKPWTLSGEQHEVDFYANAISPFLKQPNTTIRTSPYSLTHPVNIEQTIKVNLHKDSWNLYDETNQVSNAYFTLNREVSFNHQTNQLTLKYHYQTHQNTVPVDDFSGFLKDLNNAYDLTNYGLYWHLPAPTMEETDYLPYFIIGYFSVGALLLVLAFIMLIREKRPDDYEAKFYPVDNIKYLALSFMTFGVYTVYWLYKNWQYIKERDQSNIMPLARAIFSIIWYYPLAKQIFLINKDKLTKRDHAIISLLLVAFIIGYLISNTQGIYVFLGLAFQIFCVFFLVLLVNMQNPVRSPGYLHNSKWRIRHLFAAIPLSIFLAFTFATSIYFIPSTHVVDGHKIWDNDLKFMYRAKILEPGERLGLFYSSDLFSIQKDGNGLTDRKVFSYWKEDNQLVREYAYFDEIDDISLDQSTGSTLDDSTLTITRTDGSNFILYLSKESFGDKRFVKSLKERMR